MQTCVPCRTPKRKLCQLQQGVAKRAQLKNRRPWHQESRLLHQPALRRRQFCLRQRPANKWDHVQERLLASVQERLLASVQEPPRASALLPIPRGKDLDVLENHHLLPRRRWTSQLKLSSLEAVDFRMMKWCSSEGDLWRLPQICTLSFHHQSTRGWTQSSGSRICSCGQDARQRIK